jgi:uncharacterized membrane protein YqjE
MRYLGLFAAVISLVAAVVIMFGLRLPEPRQKNIRLAVVAMLMLAVVLNAIILFQ